MKYKVYFEIGGKKMVTEVYADNRDQAKKAVMIKLKFHKIEATEPTTAGKMPSNPVTSKLEPSNPVTSKLEPSNPVTSKLEPAEGKEVFDYLMDIMCGKVSHD